MKGTIQNVVGRKKDKPYGIDPRGDRIYWIREVGGFSSQEALARKAGVDRLRVLGLEKGKGWNSQKVVECIQRALGQPYDHFRSYIEGAYGPPGREAAQVFLSGEPPTGLPPKKEMPRVYLEALGVLSLQGSRNYTEAAWAHLETFAAHLANGIDAQMLARQIAELDADARGKSVGVREL